MWIGVGEEEKRKREKTRKESGKVKKRNAGGKKGGKGELSLARKEGGRKEGSWQTENEGKEERRKEGRKSVIWKKRRKGEVKQKRWRKYADE